MSVAKRGYSQAGREAIQRARQERVENHDLVVERVPPFFERFAFYIACVSPKPRAPGEPLTEVVLRDRFRSVGLAAILPAGYELDRGRDDGGRRRRRPVERPYLLWPGYVLVGTGAGLPRLSVGFGFAELGGFLGHEGIPVKVGQKELRRLIDSLNSSRFDERVTHKSWVDRARPGDIVDIVEGPFCSMEADVERIRLREQGVDEMRVRVRSGSLRPLVTLPVDSLRPKGT